MHSDDRKWVAVEVRSFESKVTAVGSANQDVSHRKAMDDGVFVNWTCLPIPLWLLFSQQKIATNPSSRALLPYSPIKPIKDGRRFKPLLGRSPQVRLLLDRYRLRLPHLYGRGRLLSGKP